MSSIRVSVSGQRGHTIENYPDHVTFACPAKPDDDVHAALSFMGEMQFILPREAKIERRKNGESEYLVLVMPTNASLVVSCKKPEGGDSGGWPHVEIDARKKNSTCDFTFDLPRDETFEPFAVKSLFSPTE